jgi:molybdopterin converting factor small subunit
MNKESLLISITLIVCSAGLALQQQHNSSLLIKKLGAPTTETSGRTTVEAEIPNLKQTIKEAIEAYAEEKERFEQRSKLDSDSINLAFDAYQEALKQLPMMTESWQREILAWQSAKVVCANIPTAVKVIDEKIREIANAHPQPNR